MSDVDDKTARYLQRAIRIKAEQRERAEDLKELYDEAKHAGLLTEEISGIRTAVKWHFETEKARDKRLSAEAVAERLGEFADLPLGVAAVESAKKAGRKDPTRLMVEA